MYGNIEYEKPFHSLSSFNESGYIENNLPLPRWEGMMRRGEPNLFTLTFTLLSSKTYSTGQALSRQGRGVILDFSASMVMNPS
jgi:hypothetical protein